MPDGLTVPNQRLDILLGVTQYILVQIDTVRWQNHQHRGAAHLKIPFFSAAHAGSAKGLVLNDGAHPGCTHFDLNQGSQALGLHEAPLTKIPAPNCRPVPQSQGTHRIQRSGHGVKGPLHTIVHMAKTVIIPGGQPKLQTQSIDKRFHWNGVANKLPQCQ